ncbi:hypothetical protein AZF37_04140 [endosymbiont 'TC1' of Trimyema compressum]|uniref:flavodoxin domain-containing protein n=1 Tax=endosymbiont 'TC1' of Trimyema compressum TaxID=243899 RepID=UPI0007F156A2|nr:flavodoxin domain-containing protein [endosymbiont 'TC1' of Trimyema compressum]AMP20466.1 hypothetical protein AZF37_04140 [endosymbiont 'TC1' of Trimyema compressum]
MKTLILFSSKHGVAKLIAEKIGDSIGNVTIMNVKTSNPNLNEYDTIIMGSSIYAGSIGKEMKNFLTVNEALLLTKRIGLFLSGLAGEAVSKYFDNNFPQDLIIHSIMNSFMGGSFDPSKANFIERLIIKAVVGKKKCLVFLKRQLKLFQKQ